MKRLLTWPEYRKQLRDMRRLRSSVWFGWDEIPVTQQAETTYPCERIGAAPQCGNTTGLLRTTRLHREYAMTDDSRCTCPWTDPSTWTYYGDATEPGSQREFDPECPEHGLTRARWFVMTGSPQTDPRPFTALMVRRFGEDGETPVVIDDRRSCGTVSDHIARGCIALRLERSGMTQLVHLTSDEALRLSDLLRAMAEASDGGSDDR